MSGKATLLIVALVAAVSSAVVLLNRHGFREGGDAAISSSDVADITIAPSAVPTGGPEDGDRVVEAPTIGRAAESAASAQVFGRVSPDDIENAIYQRIAEQTGLRLAILTSVECDTSRCTIVFSGVDANPRYVDEYGDLASALMKPPWNDYRPTQSSMGTREVSPGAREYLLELRYVALVNASDDPEAAARQHAACAGAWARVTQQRGSSEYIRVAHERAAEHLELAARTLGLEKAQHVADELQFGPLARECHAMPY